MYGVKNYTIYFMDDSSTNVTKEQADAVLEAANKGSKLIILDGEAFAAHQITSIQRRSDGGYNLKQDLIDNKYLSESIDPLNEEVGKLYQQLATKATLGVAVSEPAKFLTQPKND